MIVGLCKRCGGRVMFHAEPRSKTAIEWADICRKEGDLVMEISDSSPMISPCPDSWGKPASDRQCPIREAGKP